MAVAFVAAGSASGTATTLSLTRPAGTSTGDLLLATCELFDGGALINSAAATGWTFLDRVQNAASGNSHSLATLWRLDNGSASYSITWGGSSQFRTGLIASYSGADSVDQHSLTAQTSNASTTMRGPTVTTAFDNEMVVMLGAKGNVGTQTPPSGMAERLDTNRQYLADVIQAAAGATGNKDSTQLAADASIGGLITLKPIVVAGGPRMIV